MNRKQYPFDQFEPFWQKTWLDNQVFKANNPTENSFSKQKKKFYVLDMFPYPSGEGLHVGHVSGYTATDIMARYRRLCGYNVLHPIGWDAFGLPAEQYAIKTGQHPQVTTQKNISIFRRQLQALGFSYDWSREINTSDPNYFRWTQWIFLQLYNTWYNPDSGKGEPISNYPGNDPNSVRLAFVADIPVNWCSELGTVLANEEVIDGKSEVGGFHVESRPMRQWVLRITAYAERLINDLEFLDWPDSVKQLQKNWIGKSEGVMLDFAIDGYSEKISVFTTRPETLFGVTYLVLSPENQLVSKIVASHKKEALNQFCERFSRLQSSVQNSEIHQGMCLDIFAIHPITGHKIPIWIADYVLMGYGTGAVMAVPAHDIRDYKFAQYFNLPIKTVIQQINEDSHQKINNCFEGEGILIESDFLNNLDSNLARKVMIEWIENKNLGKKKTHYKIRDWLFARQRYWGEPFPIIWKDGEHYPLSENELPVIPPPLNNFQPTGNIEPPLSKAKEWVAYSEKFKREVNTMPQWAGSCWYYLRFCDPHNRTFFVSQEAERYWMQGSNGGGVDLYIGGTEHAVLHLLYARFWHKVLFDLGYLSTNEPFKKLINQGLILGNDGIKMSKSRGNIVNPDEVIHLYGADALRVYEMFLGPISHSKPWSINGVEGIYRFLARVWRLVFLEQDHHWVMSSSLHENPISPALLKILHTTIKKVTEDIEILSYNTAIAQMMICTNELTKNKPVSVQTLKLFLPLLSPFAPHIVEEIWYHLGKKFPQFSGLASQTEWPSWNEEILSYDEICYPIQINGIVRQRLLFSVEATDEELKNKSIQDSKIQSYLHEKRVKKIIIVPKKLINIVIENRDC